MCAAATELVAWRPGDEALRAWAERFTDYIATKCRMAAVLQTAITSDSPLFIETRERIFGALRLILETGKADGTLRPDAHPEDVSQVISATWYLPDGPHWREHVGRMLDLVIDGLRYGSASAAARSRNSYPGPQHDPQLWAGRPHVGPGLCVSAPRLRHLAPSPTCGRGDWG